MDNFWTRENLIKVLREGGIAVMPTDTLYGIVGSALNQSTVERIYNIRKRNREKPCIILMADISELEKFSIELSKEQKNILENFGAEPTTMVLDCKDDGFKYLHRGTNTVAFRVPAPQELRDLLLKTGPLIAPSANPEGLSPAETIDEAKEYFGDQVNLYIDGGKISGKASKVISLSKDGSVEILRA